MDSPENESDLLWLSRDNDHIHKTRTVDETEPLFGTGKLPVEGEINDDDIESHSNYGSVQSKPNDKWSAESSGSPAPSSKSGRSDKKSKKKKKTRPPPKSIFDDSDDNISSAFSEDSRTALTLDSKPHMPARNWCLDFFRLVSAVTVIASLGLLATQLLPLFLAPLKSQGYFDLALKVYVACFCFLFIVVECDVPVPFVRHSQLLQTYLSRGFLYSFLGLICLQEAYSERVKEMVSTHADEFDVAWASLFMQISSWLIFACGVFYMLMGLCCLKNLRDRIRKKDKEVWKKYRKDYKEWKRLN